MAYPKAVRWGKTNCVSDLFHSVLKSINLRSKIEPYSVGFGKYKALVGSLHLTMFV